jgi:hypothetical protein
MLTPQEYIERNPPVAWLHGLDVLEWVLRGDTKATIYKHHDPQPGCLSDLRREIETHPAEPGSFDEILEDVFHRASRSREIPSEIGDLDIDRYLGGDPKCFDEVIRERFERPALTIVLDMCIPWRERDDPDMAPRHRKVYALALKAEAEGRPCRVVSVGAEKVPESQETIRFYVVIKDYNEPIYPGLWGGLKTNRSANDFLNCIMDYLHGTRDRANGTVCEWNVREDLPEDEEVIVIDSKRLTAD